jgi:hypothetical protein
MHVHLLFGPLAALIAGVLILVYPRLLTIIVALWFILFGLVGLLPALFFGFGQ